MLALLKSRRVLIVLGLVVLALIVWFAGPYFAFAEYRPLDGVVARLVAILILVIGYAVIVQLQQLRVARAGQQLAQEVTQGGAEPGAPADTSQLRKRFEEAVQTLQKSNRKGGLYALPWYIIIGPPGAGKTTVLVNSGLNFPLAQKFGREALRGVGGTRNCDWWFTDEAILLDTAGRYTTQDSDARSDAAGWGAFLQLLRKFRPRQPINGVIVALSAADVLGLDARERERQVGAIRARLDELGRHLHIDVPIYLLVTKCDLVAGFSEFFDDLGQEARAQVWGVTFPMAAAESGKAVEGFASEFDRLSERLRQRVLARMEAEREPRRRASILAFPEQFGSLKSILEDLLQQAFVTSGFDRRLLLRGVYFTSGTQEGTPIDRMLGAIARTFGVTGQGAVAASGHGKAFFIERLLKEVIFHESGLAGVNHRAQLQRVALQSAAYAACVALLVLVGLGLVLSYNANAAYIDDVNTAARALAAVPTATGGPGPEAALPQLDTLRDITAAAERYKQHVPWHMRLGLYRGVAIGDAARDAYSRELNNVLVPVLRARFEQALQTDVTAPDRLFEYLKGYLMLGESAHREADHLRYLGQVQWQQMYASDASTEQRLEQHWQQLLYQGHVQSVSLNTEAVERARVALRNASMAALMYDQLKLSYVDDQKRAVRLDIAAGSGSQVLVLRSGRALSEPVPALYSRAVFSEVRSRRRYELVEDFAQNAWVFGDSAVHPELVGDVMSLYEADYIRVWDGVIKDIAIRSSGGPQEFAQTLGIVSSTASPLKGLLLAVAQNTNLLQPDPAAGAADTAGKAAAAKLEALKKTLGAAAEGNVAAGSKVTAYFQPVRQLVEGPPGQAPIDQMLVALNQQYQRLTAIGSAVGQKSALDPQVQAAMHDAQQSMDMMAKQLPAPVGNVLAEVATRSESIVSTQAHGQLAQLYTTQVVNECQELVGGRYPLSPTSPVDAKLADFTRVFGPGGVFDAFFRDNMAQFVDTSRSQWQWKPGAAAGPASLLQQLQRAQRIRSIFFGTAGQAPQANFTLAADTLDAAVLHVSVDVDGQSFDYQSGTSKSINWPGASGEASYGFATSGGPLGGGSWRGPWSWFRLLEQAQVEAGADGRYRITLHAGGKSARLLLDAGSVRNPFAHNEIAGFRCAM